MGSGSNRIYGLDILRAFAILFVMYGHAYIFIDNHISLEKYGLINLDGVSIFFVLSGFLIGGILLKTIHATDFNKKDLVNFWIRRWFRTLPNYYLILTFLLLYFGLKHLELPRLPIRYYFFLQSFHTWHPGFFAEAWSLAIEEWFYLLIPFGLFLLINVLKIKKKASIVFIIAFVILSATAIRLWRIGAHPYTDFMYWDMNLRKQVISRLDSIMFGFLGAYFSYYKVAAWEKYKTTFFWLGLLLLYVPNIYLLLFPGQTIYYLNYFQLTLTPIGALLLLPKLNTIKTGSGPVFKFLTFTSIISYSLYLLNFTIVRRFLMPHIASLLHLSQLNSLAADLLSVVLFFLISYILAYPLYHFFEKRITALREKISRRERGAL